MVRLFWKQTAHFIHLGPSAVMLCKLYNTTHKSGISVKFNCEAFLWKTGPFLWSEFQRLINKMFMTQHLHSKKKKKEYFFNVTYLTDSFWVECPIIIALTHFLFVRSLNKLRLFEYWILFWYLKLSNNRKNGHQKNS